MFGLFPTNVFKGIEGYAKHAERRQVPADGRRNADPLRARQAGQRLPDPHMELGRGPERIRHADGRLPEEEGREEGGDADAERCVRPRRRRHLSRGLQVGRHRALRELLRAGHQGLLGRALEDRRRQARLPVPGLHRLRALRHRPAGHPARPHEVLAGARLARPGAEEQGLHRRLCRLHPEVLRGGAELRRSRR